MKLTISDTAANWYIDELGLKAGDAIKFFGKVYGVDGFSLALTKMEPHNIKVKYVYDDVIFYVEESDAWFFENHNLDISFDEDLKEPKYARVEKER